MIYHGKVDPDCFPAYLAERVEAHNARVRRADDLWEILFCDTALFRIRISQDTVVLGTLSPENGFLRADISFEEDREPSSDGEEPPSRAALVLAHLTPHILVGAFLYGAVLGLAWLFGNRSFLLPLAAPAAWFLYAGISALARRKDPRTCFRHFLEKDLAFLPLELKNEP